jgi:hypothetical protein
MRSDTLAAPVRLMELEIALEVVRRYRGPVSHIGLRKGGELYYILESTGETLLAKELVGLAKRLQEQEERAGASS